MIQIRPSNKKLNQRNLIDFEELIRYKLPKEYIEFLMKYNGGYPENNIIELRNDEIQSIAITDFFGIGVEKINDLKGEFEVYKDRIPKGYIPIGRTEGGNIVCLSGQNGSLFFWDHEMEFLNEDIGNKNLLPIANNFVDFLNMIKPDNTVEDLDGYVVEEVWVDPGFLEEMKKSGLLN